MTPYVLNEEESGVSGQKPKSIIVGSPNGDAVRPNGEVMVDTPDSIPSRSSASGKSIIGNGRNGKSGALKRVSFGSSKGSMVETLVYDHQEDLLPEFPFPEFASPPVVNGEDSRLHPAKVRVKFIESQSLAQVRPASAPSSPDVTLDLSSDTMTSPGSENIARQISVDSGVDNPFRPDGELSREADTIVSLIKEGKPITPVKSDELVDGAAVVANGHPASPDSGSPVREGAIDAVDASGAKVGANGSVATKDGNKRQKAQPGVVEVKHSVIAPPTDTPQVEQVTIKKKPKRRCCVIQ